MSLDGGGGLPSVSPLFSEGVTAPTIEHLPAGLAISMPLEGDAFMPSVLGLQNGEGYALAEPHSSRSGGYDGEVSDRGGSKRYFKTDDPGEEEVGTYIAKRPKVAVDSVEPSDLAGNVFLRVETPWGGALLTFDGDLTRPLFFREEEQGAVEVPAAAVGAECDALDLPMPGVDVDDYATGARRTATVGELVSFLKHVYTNGSGDGTGLSPPAVYLLVKCDEAIAYLTFDPDNLKAKVISSRGGRAIETTPQQFELEAGCHARKWRNSFKVQAAMKVIRQGILTAAPYVELHAYLHRMLGIDSAGPSAGKLNRGESGGYGRNPAMGRPPPAPPRALPPAASFDGRGASLRVAPRGAGVPEVTNGANGVRYLGTSFVAIPIAPAGKVAGPLTPAEVQAIQAVVALTDGPKLAWAVQGIMHHVWKQHCQPPSQDPEPEPEPEPAPEAEPEAEPEPAADPDPEPEPEPEPEQAPPPQPPPTSSTD